MGLTRVMVSLTANGRFVFSKGGFMTKERKARRREKDKQEKKRHFREEEDVSGTRIDVTTIQSWSPRRRRDLRNLVGAGTRIRRVSTEKKPTVRNLESRPGRNDPCSCGSGRKYKRCCGRPGGVREGT